jgi:hypothetical protein
VAATKLWVVPANEVPFHHSPVVVSSIATDTLVMVVAPPELGEAAPVIVPFQLVP